MRGLFATRPWRAAHGRWTRGTAWAARVSARWTIRTRLVLAFGFVLALFTGTTAFALWQIGAIERDSELALQAQSELASVARDMRQGVDALYINVLQLGLATHGDDIRFYKEALDKALAAYQTQRGELMARTHDAADLPGGAQAAGKLKEAEATLRSVDQLVRQRVAQAQSQGEGSALELDVSLVNQLTANMKNEFDFWGQAVEGLVAATSEMSRQRQQQVRATAALARVVGVAASALALLIGALAAWAIARNVALPVGQAVQAAERMAQGDLAFDIARREGRDETAALMSAFARMQGSLRQLVADVRQSAATIETATDEVAAGHTDLSHRTEDTAARLQGTAGEAGQLSRAAREAAQSAQVAEAVALRAAGQAEQGRAAVGQVVQNMRDIAAHSDKIAEIIGVIDSIAFQTNILALNAAVEAARAGEQGRGFAVVASEVRSLSQRTSEAARGVKDLILASVQRVEAGTALVDEAGARMESTVGSAREVMAAIQSIAATMAAQSEGMDRVSTAMDEVDRLTQHNAALVEQGAAAAESLHAQAQRLSRAVAAFRVDAAA